MTLRRFLLAACLAVTPALAMAQGTIRIRMTAADIPLAHGQPDQGLEGDRAPWPRASAAMSSRRAGSPIFARPASSNPHTVRVVRRPGQPETA